MAYFDNAATTYPKPEEVYLQMDSFYRNNGGSAGRGKYEIARSASDLIAETRILLQDILRCHNKQIIFTPTATVALNMIIQGVIETGVRNVYISPFEHNAVTRVLHSFEQKGVIDVIQLKVSESLNYDLEQIRYQFENKKPDFVIVSHASNVIGLVSPVEEIFALAKKHNAVTLVDMAQTAGLVELDVGLQNIDFAVFAGHKTLYGPTGISGFAMKPDYNLPAILFGGTGYESANQDMPESLPEKFELGTINILGIAGLNAALKWHKKIGFSALLQKEKENRARLVRILKNYNFINVIDCADTENYVGIVTCTIKGISSDSASSIFDNGNISVRTGLHCAPLAHKFLGTFPAGTIRFSAGYFTDDDDFKELEELLEYIEENI